MRHGWEGKDEITKGKNKKMKEENIREGERRAGDK